MLTRLIAPWCQSKMDGNRARPFEARRIVNGCLEGQRRNRPDTRDGHHAETDLILGGRAFDPLVQLQKGWIATQCITLDLKDCVDDPTKTNGRAEEIRNLA